MVAEEENCGNREERVRKLVEAGYETVAREIIACIRCPLHESAIKRVIGKGSCNPKVFFIGEAPEKVRTNQEFLLRQGGKKLDQMVEYMGLSEEDWFVTNTVKCRPRETESQGYRK